MPGKRLHRRLPRPDVEVDSPLIECRLLNLSTSGLAIETNVGLRLGVPYPFRLRHAGQSVGTEAEVRWCRLVRTEPGEGDESRPVYRAGAAFVEWQDLSHGEPMSPLEDEIDSTIDQWIEGSRKPEAAGGSRPTIIRQDAPRAVYSGAAAEASSAGEERQADPVGDHEV